jgi:hypothetical protein
MARREAEDAHEEHLGALAVDLGGALLGPGGHAHLGEGHELAGSDEALGQLRLDLRHRAHAHGRGLVHEGLVVGREHGLLAPGRRVLGRGLSHRPLHVVGVAHDDLPVAGRVGHRVVGALAGDDVVGDALGALPDGRVDLLAVLEGQGAHDAARRLAHDHELRLAHAWPAGRSQESIASVVPAPTMKRSSGKR